jgi:hypothetical protein
MIGEKKGNDVLYTIDAWLSEAKVREMANKEDFSEQVMKLYKEHRVFHTCTINFTH